MQARGPILSTLEGAFGVSEAVPGLIAPGGTVGFLAAVDSHWLWTGTPEVPSLETAADRKPTLEANTAAHR